MPAAIRQFLMDLPSFVFVYGTLIPGDVRWPIIEPFVIDRRRVTVAGRVYDTGLGYPAARFDQQGTIRGWLLHLDPARLEHALTVLDEVEGAVVGYYRRVAVVTDGGAHAFSYEYGLPTTGLVDLDGAWPGQGPLHR